MISVNDPRDRSSKDRVLGDWATAEGGGLRPSGGAVAAARAGCLLLPGRAKGAGFLLALPMPAPCLTSSALDTLVILLTVLGAPDLGCSPR